MRLGLDLCVPHRCQCGSDVDAQDRHAALMPWSAKKHLVRLQDIRCSTTSSGEPSTLLEYLPPRSISLIPWQGGKLLIWDVTVASTLAASYADTAATGMGLVADQAATRKSSKYVDFTAAYIFQPIAVKNLGPINASALDFISNLGQKSSYDREAEFLFQHISVTIQRFNSVLLHDSFCIDCLDQ